MRRAGVFITAGPALGLTAIMLMSLFVESRFPAIHASAMFVLLAFVVCLPPSFISGMVDIISGERRWRFWATTITGAAVGFFEMLYIHGSATALQAAAFCIFGAFPAAICSWLSIERRAPYGGITKA